MSALGCAKIARSWDCRVQEEQCPIQVSLNWFPMAPSHDLSPPVVSMCPDQAGEIASAIETSNDEASLIPSSCISIIERRPRRDQTLMESTPTQYDTESTV